MPDRFVDVDVLVEAHDQIPDGCAVRFRMMGQPRPVQVIRYAPPLGAPGPFRIEGRSRGGAEPARAATVEVRGQGTAMLVWGGDRGLRLVAAQPAATTPAISWAEPYLLVPPDSIVS